jgi:hypothetical protein
MVTRDRCDTCFPILYAYSPPCYTFTLNREKYLSQVSRVTVSDHLRPSHSGLWWSENRHHKILSVHGGAL